MVSVTASPWAHGMSEYMLLARRPSHGSNPVFEAGGSGKKRTFNGGSHSDLNLRTLVPKTINGMVFGTRVLKYWVPGPSGKYRSGQTFELRALWVRCRLQTAATKPRRGKQCAYMYSYVYLYIYICIHIYMLVFMYLFIYIHTYILLHMHIHT